MSKIKEILEGHINELKALAGLEKKQALDIFKQREVICLSCPLKNGNNCNSKKYINPETKEISDQSEEGFVKGCGCRLSAKQKSPSSSCPAKFWGGEFNKKQNK